MDLNEYQEKCRETAVYTKVNAGGERIAYCALALAGEAGEAANVVKKIIRDEGFVNAGHILYNNDLEGQKYTAPITASRKLLDECSDVLWYVAMLAHEAGFTLEEVAKWNLEKLKERYGGK